MTNGSDPAFYDGSEREIDQSLIDPAWRAHPGLTKRELFAAMAMQGMLANPAFRTDQDKIAEWAVTDSDALIIALNKPQETK